MKNYELISIEITQADDVIATSSEVETERIPLIYGTDNASYNFMSNNVDESSYNT